MDFGADCLPNHALGGGGAPNESGGLCEAIKRPPWIDVLALPPGVLFPGVARRATPGFVCWVYDYGDWLIGLLIGWSVVELVG